jgi:hypothetical protein
MSVFVWGTYDDMRSVDGAVGALVEGRFPPEEIRVHLSDAEGQRELPVRHKTRAPLGALIGALFGAGVWLFFFGELNSGIWIGAAIGAVAGAYGGIFWWRQEVDLPPTGAGKALVGITAPEGRAREATAILRSAGASRVGVNGDPPART